MEWESGDVGEGIAAVARRGGWSVCDRLGSRGVVALAEESEMRCGCVSKVCDCRESFEDGGLVMCCAMHGLCPPFRRLCVGFLNDGFFCGCPIWSRLLLFHHLCPQVEIDRSSVSFLVCLSLFVRLEIQTSIFAYGLSGYHSPIRGLTCCVVFAALSTINASTLLICPQMPRGAPRIRRLQRLQLAHLCAFGPWGYC